ncbi:hypothetical protein [Salinimicrobium sediminilitoris]|uniref:hypothetical protein n=1 Tax=Salinimicrobium sediminilitoris TaxID=2876715 RepID=UPI001E44DF69|nr:hypothetical protein [Salinimicrobium sediminilitoris]MCC8360037.1 hypothetical protein [Salinimicrobium sediminilitoris]
MKNSIKLLSIILCFGLFNLTACSSDDDSGGDDEISGCNNFESEYAPVADALSAYSQNPNAENCEAYKNALLEFYNEFSDCPYWGDYYQEAYDQIQGVDCSEAETD